MRHKYKIVLSNSTREKMVHIESADEQVAPLLSNDFIITLPEGVLHSRNILESLESRPESEITASSPLSLFASFILR